MKKAVKENKARAKDLAYLEDRILSEQGKPQIYGTQYTYDDKGQAHFYPIKDMQNVNKRRRSVGLNTIEEQAKVMKISN